MQPRFVVETWTLRAVDQKQVESFEMWCWRRMEKISWTDHARNEDVLLRVKEQRNILHEIRKRKAKFSDLSRQPVDSFFKGRAFVSDSLTLGDRIDMLPRNVGK
jgi:hypothetical protein